MLHHIALEIAPGDLEAGIRFWEAIGFARVPVPDSLADRATWMEKSGTQIHLLLTGDPVVPGSGHPAVIVADLPAAIERLEAAGFSVQERQQHWGERRAIAVMAGGQRVEMMAAPPASTVSGSTGRDRPG